jgi:protein-disulfide isomerase
MPLLRRTLLLAPLFLPALARAADDPRMAERAVGSPTAPVTVREYFSLTCPHCARFARDTLPEVHKQLIETGKLRYIYEDFPLDRVALMAAMVARALPPERYEPFVLALLASQDRWAFARGVNNTEEIFKMAALAGMSRATFDATINDDKLRDAILAAQDAAEKKYDVKATPTFIFTGPSGKDHHDSGELSYDAFAKAVAEAAGNSG